MGGGLVGECGHRKPPPGRGLRAKEGDSETRKGTKGTKQETSLSCPSLSFVSFVFQTPLHHPNLFLRQPIQLIYQPINLCVQ
jgi:hypothetical protein